MHIPCSVHTALKPLKPHCIVGVLAGVLQVSGITWTAPTSHGLWLVEQMGRSIATLSSLRTLRIRERGGYLMPIKQLREAVEALPALRDSPFFSPGGPRREEILFMGDLLRQPMADMPPPGEAVVKLLAGARAGRVKRKEWEEKVTHLMAQGRLTRGQLMSLIAAEALRDVGFAAAELLASGHTLPVMREGGYLAAELRAIGLKARRRSHRAQCPQLPLHSARSVHR